MKGLVLYYCDELVILCRFMHNILLILQGGPGGAGGAGHPGDEGGSVSQIYVYTLSETLLITAQIHVQLSFCLL